MADKNLKPVLKLGVRKGAGGIDAHSWVEYEGEILNDSQFVKAEFVAFEMNGKTGGGEATPGARNQS